MKGYWRVLAVYIFSCNPMYGQTLCTLTGTVTDSENKPVSFASVLLFNLMDSVFINGTSTEEDGQFELKSVRPGNYYLKVQMLGYKLHKTQSIKIDDGKTSDSVLIIKLVTDTKILADVSVTASRPLIERQSDRMVINVQNSVV